MRNLHEKMCNRFLKITRSRLVQQNPQKEVEPIAPTRKLSHKQNILYRSTNIQVKLNLKNKLSPLPLSSNSLYYEEAGEEECSSLGSRRPGHPHSTPWSCAVEHRSDSLSAIALCKEHNNNNGSAGLDAFRFFYKNMGKWGRAYGIIYIYILCDYRRHGEGEYNNRGY